MPAFDINPVPSNGNDLETGISEHSGNEGSVEAAIEVAPFIGIKQDDAALRAREMAQTISTIGGFSSSTRHVNSRH